MPWPKQLFRLSADLLESVSLEEVRASARDMKEAGLYAPPFDDYSIEVPFNSISKSFGIPDCKTEFPYLITFAFANDRFVLMSAAAQDGMEAVHDLVEDAIRGKPALAEIMHLGAADMAERLRMLLIVLLATRNVEKTVTHNSLARFGRGKQRAHYCTTIRIGKLASEAHGADGVDKPLGSSPGTPKRPHLRRGHLRRQHYGPGGELIRQIFIQPVFVNADAEYIAARTAYNVSKPKGDPS